MILSFTVSMFAVPNANAAERMTFPFVDALPNPAGIGQAVLINLGLVNQLRDNADGWNMTLRIFNPDGSFHSNTTLKTWSTGTVGKRFTFTEPGNYTLEALFNGETYRGDDYLASRADNYTLTILEDWVKPSHPGHSLPTEYWNRPVDSQLREWYSIMGSWLQAKPRRTNLYAPYNDAPMTAHILWSTPDIQYSGGLAGGNYEGAIPGAGFQHGDAYEAKFNNAIIVAGKLFYNVAPVYSGSSNAMNQTIRALDLHTGKELWTLDVTKFGGNSARLIMGQIMLYMNENNRGTWEYLWVGTGTTGGSTWYALNPINGQHIFTINNVPAVTAGGLSSGPMVYAGPNGELLMYRTQNLGTTANPIWSLRMWNSTLAVEEDTGGLAWGNSVNTAGSPTVVNGTRGWQWSIPLPRNLGEPIAAFNQDRVVLANVSTAGVTLTIVGIDEENFGWMLANQRFWSAPEEWKSFGITTSSGPVSEANGQSGWACFSDDPYIGVFWTKENRVNYVFSLENGAFLYETPPQPFGDSWGGVTSNSAPEKIIVYGMLIEGGGSGVVHCYNASTGTLIWKHNAKDEYMESYHGENWWTVPLFVSCEKVYFSYGVHSSQEPKPRGAPFYALDVYTGDVVWQIDGAFRQLAWGGGRAIIGDSIIATLDSYDSQIYGIGKGPSETTVTSSNPAAVAGNTVLISGTIMDISPGTEQNEIQKRFSKGVPAVSDESMSDWMLYVYKNFGRPMDTTGVEVTIFAKQGDREIDIGNVVSDDSGRYAASWAIPDDATGTWDIYAYFSGSGAYFGSWAKSEMAVSAAAEKPATNPAYEWYIIGMGIAIIAVVLIVGLLIILKKK
ncbi:MAG: PQQ-binding-like beta-propeller repeat protein [Nitrososphaerota archaeon]|nr:PQQ-binding-like beta-propeller repeat protein [Nitrososphaerota archaeon]